MSNYRIHLIVDVPEDSNLRLIPSTSDVFMIANPVLEIDELGFATDTNVFKVGDGVTPWNDLNVLAGTTDPAGTTITVRANGTTWPSRPTDRADVTVQWIGSDEAHPPTEGMVGVDIWMRDQNS